MESMKLFNNPIQACDAKKASEMSRNIEDSDNAKKIKVARDFETILISQLMNQMKQTIGNSGFLQDSSSKQIQDMFWDFLGKEVGRNGGFGLWKNVYESMSPDKFEMNTAEEADQEKTNIDMIG